MNETVRLLQAHHSSRKYKADPVPAEILDAIIECARLAPTSINSHEISLVVVRNAASRARIAEIAGGQPWIAQAPVFIAVVVDLYKTALGVEKAGAEQVFQRSLEGILAAASDAGIAMATLMTAARAFGLGMICLGCRQTLFQWTESCSDISPKSLHKSPACRSRASGMRKSIIRRC